MHIEFADIAIVGLLIFLEGILSIDNALVLAILARPLPKHQQQRALLYGLAGAFVFRIAAISLAAWLIDWVWVKYLGGGYLIYVAVKDLFFKAKDTPHGAPIKVRGFWMTVVVIELTDIAFAVDSILAAVALTDKLWVIVTGGLIGLILMRFAASVFIKLLDRFPGLERTAYILVLIIGLKLVLEGLHLPHVHFDSYREPAFWAFWGLMLATVLHGFLSRGGKEHAVKDPTPGN